MNRLKFFFIILLVGISFQGWSQIEHFHISDQGIYSDRITDEEGYPLTGIKVQVQNTGAVTFSDSNGDFSIKAKIGDIIVLSKDGKFINSYRLDGSNDYKVEDLSNEESTYSSISKKKITRTYYLDSAAFYLNKNPYKSIEFIEQQLQSKARKSKKEMAKTFTLLGDSYEKLKQPDLAVNNYIKALDYSKEASIKIKLAKALYKINEYQNSIQYLESIKISHLPNTTQINILESIGDNEIALNNHNAALLSYKKALKIATKNNITSAETSLNTKIAEILAKKGKKEEADSYIQNTLKSSKSRQLQERAKIQDKVAGIYQSNKEFGKEIKIRKQTLEALEEAETDIIIAEPISDNSDENITTQKLNLAIGKAYINKNDYDKAIPYLEKSALKAKEVKDLEIEKKALQNLSELYKKVGNSKKALQKYQEYAKIVDKLYQQKEEEIQSVIQLNNELRDKQNRINSLEKDRKLSESQLKLSESEKELTQANYKSQQQLIYALIIGMVLFSIALFAMYRSNKQRRLANNLLALKSLRSQMNPHFIFNALNSVNSFIAQNDERTANRYLTNFSTLMRNVLNNSEEDFIPLSKEIELLQLYLQLEHSRFKDKFDYQINIDSNVKISEFQIPPMLLQPYVENAVWHGLRYKKEKGELLINIQQKDNETITITISDNGIGRTKSKELKTQNQKKQQSKGMNNIKKRISILNEMYNDKVDVFIDDLFDDKSGTKVVLTLKKD